MNTPTRLYRNRNGMSVSVADVIISHIAVFGERQPSNMTFNDAAERVRVARPDDWSRVFDLALQERTVNADRTYEEIAVAVLDAEIDRLCASKGSDVNAALLKLEGVRNTIAPVRPFFIKTI